MASDGLIADGTESRAARVQLGGQVRLVRRVVAVGLMASASGVFIVMRDALGGGRLSTISQCQWASLCMGAKVNRVMCSQGERW